MNESFKSNPNNPIGSEGVKASSKLYHDIHMVSGRKGMFKAKSNKATPNVKSGSVSNPICKSITGFSATMNHKP